MSDRSSRNSSGTGHYNKKSKKRAKKREELKYKMYRALTAKEKIEAELKKLECKIKWLDEDKHCFESSVLKKKIKSEKAEKDKKYKNYKKETPLDRDKQYLEKLKSQSIENRAQIAELKKTVWSELSLNGFGWKG